MEKIPMTFSYSPTDFWRGELIYQPQNADSMRIFKSRILEDGHYSDIGLVAKLPGNKNENYMILSGFAYPAQTEIVRMLSRNRSLASIYDQASKQIADFPEYFIMVFEVIGSEYSAIETKMLFYREINSETPLQRN